METQVQAQYAHSGMAQRTAPIDAIISAVTDTQGRDKEVYRAFLQIIAEMQVLDHDLAYPDGKGYCPMCQLKMFRELATACQIIPSDYDMTAAHLHIANSPLPRAALVIHLESYMNDCVFHQVYAQYLQSQHNIFPH